MWPYTKSEGFREAATCEKSTACVLKVSVSQEQQLLFLAAALVEAGCRMGSPVPLLELGAAAVS